MNAPARLGLFGGALAATFGLALAAGSVLVPDEVVDRWSVQDDAPAHTEHE